MKKFAPSTKAIALTDIQIFFGCELIYSCKKGETITFKSIVYKDNMKGYLAIKDNIELPLVAFKLI